MESPPTLNSQPKLLESPRQLLERLKQDDLFQQWHKLHPHAYLSHFFCALDTKGVMKSPWEIGYFDQDTQKITVFRELETMGGSRNGNQGKGFAVKPADDVFKTDTMTVEELDVEQIKTEVTASLETFQQQAKEFFPHEALGDGFLIVQTLEEVTVWNFTFIAQSLKFCNVKIDARTGKVHSHQEFSVIDKG